MIQRAWNDGAQRYARLVRAKPGIGVTRTSRLTPATEVDTQRLAELLRTAVDHSTLRVGSREFSAEQFRQFLRRPSRHDQELSEAKRAPIVVDREHLLLLADHLRSVLAEFIEPSSDRIGHAFPVVAGLSSSSFTISQAPDVVLEGSVTQMETFARVLARGAAVLGTEGVAKLVFAWRAGEPVSFTTSSVLNGSGLLAGPLSPLRGIRFDSLPVSTDRLPRGLPLHGGRTLRDYLGRMLLTVEHTAAPALFRPDLRSSVRVARATEFPGLEADIVCKALALEADAFLEVAFSWNDFGDFSTFRATDQQQTWSSGQARFRSRDATSFSQTTDIDRGVTTIKPLSPSQFEVDDERLRSTLAALAEPDSESLQIALSRWVRSKDTSNSLADRFIDLRVALESLYLQDFPHENSREMTLRLSLFGAWHLGADAEERSEVRKRLRATYHAASQAVHTGDVRPNPENQNLLSDAQALVRRGLLKLLTNGAPPSWGDLILGADSHEHDAEENR